MQDHPVNDPLSQAHAPLLLRALDFLNQLTAYLGSLAIGIAACVLSWEATARYLFKIPSDWQDEVTIFLLVGATFLSCAWVQQQRCCHSSLVSGDGSSGGPGSTLGQ